MTENRKLNFILIYIQNRKNIIIIIIKFKFYFNYRNGCLVCEISRKSGFWTIRGKGYYTQNTPNAESIVPILGKVFKGDNSLVKIYAE